MNKFGIPILILLLAHSVQAQIPILGQPLFCQDSAHCTLGIEGKLPSKWISFNYEKSAPSQADGGEVSISQLRRMGAKVKLPLVNRAGFKMFAGLSYKQDYIGLSRNASEGGFPWESVDQQRFNHRGAELIWMQPFRGHSYLVGRASATISNASKGFHFREDWQDTQFSFTEMMVARPSSDMEIGLGFYVRRSFGRTSTFPLLLLNKNISRNWGVEAVLPSFLQVRRNLGDKAAVVFGAKASGSTVSLANSGNNPGNLHLRRSEILSNVSYMQEIADPLWIAFELGYRQPISMGVFSSEAPRTAISTSSLGGATYFNTSIFLVPPDRLIEKLSRKRLP